ncbi:hypothetical protein MA16_Dca027015 [Dendrobium catenatum]|uniref:Uncharacterized protein n=1 Tax=Dendrobium catenatum TaxID=906689 RepID=A0A2I0X002_9ASPA|nr:hypothetical protein MA16_Dca027015 [Dendrobium catenatum]
MKVVSIVQIELYNSSLIGHLPARPSNLTARRIYAPNLTTKTLSSGLSIAEININDMEVCGKVIGSGIGNIFTAGVKIPGLKLIVKDDSALCSHVVVQCNVTEGFDPKFVISGDEVNGTHEDRESRSQAAHSQRQRGKLNGAKRLRDAIAFGSELQKSSSRDISSTDSKLPIFPSGKQHPQNKKMQLRYALQNAQFIIFLVDDIVDKFETQTTNKVKFLDRLVLCEKRCIRKKSEPLNEVNVEEEIVRELQLRTTAIEEAVDKTFIAHQNIEGTM